MGVGPHDEMNRDSRQSQACQYQIDVTVVSVSTVNLAWETKWIQRKTPNYDVVYRLYPRITTINDRLVLIPWLSYSVAFHFYVRTTRNGKKQTLANSNIAWGCGLLNLKMNDLCTVDFLMMHWHSLGTGLPYTTRDICLNSQHHTPPYCLPSNCHVSSTPSPWSGTLTLSALLVGSGAKFNTLLPKKPVSDSLCFLI